MNLNWLHNVQHFVHNFIFECMVKNVFCSPNFRGSSDKIKNVDTLPEMCILSCIVCLFLE